MKKMVILLTALFFLVFGGACFTPALYDKPAETTRNFVEEVSSFLITEDGKNLIVIGKEHHYIFSANDTLKVILSWPEKKRVKASFQTFSIRSDQTVSGMYNLDIENSQNLTAETKALLLSKGFSENKLEKRLYHSGWIQGTRYSADKFQVPATMKFNQTYTIKMIESVSSASEAIKRILLTPLALTADGLLILGGVPLMTFFLMFE
jgi:hypothetical protein